MAGGYVWFAALCVTFRACAFALAAEQAGEPMTVNVDYDVPEFGAKDAAMRAKLGAEFDAKLRAKSSLRAGSGLGATSGTPFSAFALRGREGDASSQATLVTVHVPSPVGSASALVADAKADVAFLGQIAKAQDAQEQRFLSEVAQATAHLHRLAGA